MHGLRLVLGPRKMINHLLQLLMRGTKRSQSFGPGGHSRERVAAGRQVRILIEIHWTLICRIRVQPKVKKIRSVNKRSSQTKFMMIQTSEETRHLLEPQTNPKVKLATLTNQGSVHCLARMWLFSGSAWCHRRRFQGAVQYSEHEQVAKPGVIVIYLFLLLLLLLSFSRQAQAGGKLDKTRGSCCNLFVVLAVVVVVVEQDKYKQMSIVTKPGAASGFLLL